MLYVKDHKREEFLFSPYAFGPRRQAHVKASWASLFRSEILEQLPVAMVTPYYDREQGRPSKELYALIGALVLQQTFDLSDKQTVEQYSFNLLWHVALGITGTKDAETFISARTLWTMRQRLIESGADAKVFELVTKKLVTVFGVDTSRQRLDSTHIESNMRHLSRIGLFGATIRKFLVNLRRQHRGLFEELGAELTDRYINKGDGVFSLVKPSEAGRKLESLCQDLFKLVERFKDDTVVGQMKSFGLMVQLLSEQCQVSAQPQSDESTVSLKAPKEISSNSLQGPSDPEATYSGHKGKGYTAQLMESYDPQRAQDATVPNLITHVEVDPAHVSDVHATIPAIEAAQQLGLGPKHVVADTLYGSDQNVQEAQARGVELVTPAVASPKNVLGEQSLGLDRFTLDEDNLVLRCAQGHTPIATAVAGKETTACFAHELCGGCPQQLQCPVRWEEQGYVVRVTPKRVRLDTRRARERTFEFLDVYRWRAGIEALMSLLKNFSGAGRLRYRGLRRLRYVMKLKAAGVNILRAAAAYAARLANGLPGGPSAAKAIIDLLLYWLFLLEKQARPRNLAARCLLLAHTCG